MNEEEERVAGFYYFSLGESFSGFPKYLCIDHPPEYRHVKDYRTTLGHKVNHNLAGTNVLYGFVRHPSHGPVVGHVAIKPIAKGQEIFVDYNYDLDNAPQWYVDNAERAKNKL